MNQEENSDDRCGFCIEGGHLQCVYSAGHEGIHKWGEMFPGTSSDSEDDADYEEWLSEMSEVLGDSGSEIQSESKTTK